MSVAYMRRAAEMLVVPSSQTSPHRAATALSSSFLAMNASGSTYSNADIVDESSSTAESGGHVV